MEKVKTLLKLYEGAVQFTKDAKDGMVNGDKKLKNESISKVISIITQLDCALDLEVGGELAENLSGLYKYIMNRITHANVHDDADAINEVEGLLNNLKEAFEGAANKTSTNPESKNNLTQANVSENQPNKERGLRIEI